MSSERFWNGSTAILLSAPEVALLPEKLPGEQAGCRDRRNDDQRRDFAAGATRNGFVRPGLIRALDPFGRQLKSPGQDERNGETENGGKDHGARYHPRKKQRRDNGRGHLNYEPGNDGVRDRHAVNMASLQLGEEVLRVHFIQAVRSPPSFNGGIENFAFSKFASKSVRPAFPFL